MSVTRCHTSSRHPSHTGKLRFNWWRAYHGLPEHPKWRSVGRQAKVPVSVVFHIAACLLDTASRSTPRGSVATFKPFDCAGIVDVSPEDVERVLAVLRDIHWIEGNMLGEWDERQPTREDPTAFQRKRDERDRKSLHVTHSHAHVPQPSAPDIDRDISLTSSEYEAAREAASDKGKKGWKL